MQRKRFAWWPVQVTSGQRIWLNTFYEHKNMHEVSTGKGPWRSMYFVWTETEPEKVWRLLKEGAVQKRNVWNDPLLTKKDKL